MRSMCKYLLQPFFVYLLWSCTTQFLALFLVHLTKVYMSLHYNSSVNEPTLPIADTTTHMEIVTHLLSCYICKKKRLQSGTFILFSLCTFCNFDTVCESYATFHKPSSLWISPPWTCVKKILCLDDSKWNVSSLIYMLPSHFLSHFRADQYFEKEIEILLAFSLHLVKADLQSFK